MEALRIRREFVPEAVEIDPLAPHDQPFHIWAAETEVPEQRTRQDLVPWTDARHRSIQEGEFRDTSRLAGCEGVADHVSDVVGDEIDLVDLERVEYGGDVARLGLLVVATGGVGGEAHGPQDLARYGVASRPPG